MPDITVPFFTAVPASPPPWPGIVVVMEGNGISPRSRTLAFFAQHLQEQ